MECEKDKLISELRAQAEQYKLNPSDVDTTMKQTRERVDNDGVVYEYDEEKRAWFPKEIKQTHTSIIRSQLIQIDEDFIAAYQYNYGVSSEQLNSADTTAATANTQAVKSTASTAASSAACEISTATQHHQQQDAKLKDKKISQSEGWIDVENTRNSNVYVSGLPIDMTEEEFIELMGKCGIIVQDEETQQYKIKLYRDANGQLKGDGRCCYLKVESVDLALQILDGMEYKGNRIHVEQAVFTMKGEYNPSLRKKKNAKKRKKSNQSKLLSWSEDKSGKHSKLDNIVIIKNIFHPDEFEKDPTYITDLKATVKEECESKFGPLKKIIVFDRHPQGVISLTFNDAEDAEQCMQTMNGRYFAQRKLHAEGWDGRTNYQIEETDLESQERRKRWESYISENTSETNEANVRNCVNYVHT